MIGASASGQGELLTKTVSGSPGELAVSENPAGSSCNYDMVVIYGRKTDCTWIVSSVRGTDSDVLV